MTKPQTILIGEARDCEGCRHLRVSTRREYLPQVTDYWCVANGQEWLGFLPVFSETCQGEQYEPTPPTEPV